MTGIEGVHLGAHPHAQWVSWGVALQGDSIQAKKAIFENFLGLAKKGLSQGDYLSEECSGREKRK